MGRTTTWAEYGVTWTVDGILHTKDILVFVEEAAQSPNLDRMKYFIWDVSEVTEYINDEDDIELSAHYATSLELYNSRLIGALVTTTPSMQVLCEEYIETMVAMKSPWTMKVFSERDEASKWIESMTS